VFFIGSAPLSANGPVNLSPKGLDMFRGLRPQHIPDLDLTRRGNETAAHEMESELSIHPGGPQIIAGDVEFIILHTPVTGARE